MAGMTSQTLGLGRKVLLDAFTIENDRVQPLWRDILGRVWNTTQLYETVTQISGLGPAEYTAETEEVRFDDMSRGFSRNFKPFMVTKGLRYTVLFNATLQYRKVLAKQPEIARSFMEARNIFAANILNNAFTDTTSGMGGETLISATHGTLRPGVTQSNLITGVLSPLTLERALALLGRQQSPIGLPMPVKGKVKLVVPPELGYLARRIVESDKMATTANNDKNVIRNEVEVSINPYLTSTTAWFLIAQDQNEQGLFMLEQIPYDIQKLEMTLNLFIPWIAYESYVPGWIDWRGLTGSSGL